MARPPAHDACTCDYPERYAKNRADWKIGRAPTSMFKSTVDGRPWPPYPVWHRPDCDSLEVYPLAPLSGDAPKCVKCGGAAWSQFHEASWTYVAHSHDYWRTDLRRWQCALTERYYPVEHIDRTCSVCKWAWLERTAQS